jgi:hypothetical protein
MPGIGGAENAACFSYSSRKFWSDDWQGESFMAVGQRDAILGGPVMEELRGMIHGCPEAMSIPDAGHFVQEYGEPIAERALEHFGLS